MEVSGQLHIPVAISLRKQPQVPTKYEAEWASLLVWTLWRKEKFLASCRMSKHDLLAIQPAA